MSSEIDSQSLVFLRELHGETVLQIVGTRYPSVAAYSEVYLVTAARTVLLTLRIEDVDNELEVSVPLVKPFDGSAPRNNVDRFELAGFRIGGVYRLQRRELIQWSAADQDSYVGSSPRMHQLREVDEGDGPGGQVVDAGIALVSKDGLSLELYADSFPLVFQLRLSIAASIVPNPRRVLVT